MRDEYKRVKGTLEDAVAPINGEEIKKLADKSR